MRLQRNLLGSLIVSVLASGSAHAVFLSPSGLGEALVFPYYTVNGGNATMLTIGNSTSEGKALKVHILESYNGREVLTFNLYLSPHDIWTAEIADGSGEAGAPATINTSDNSCTVPQFAGATVPFRNLGYSGPNDDSGPTDFTRTREGSIEVVEMGVVTNATQHTLDAITHVNGVPNDCTQLVSAWSVGGYWNVDSSVDLAPPDGGLYGTATIVNVPAGTVEAYNAEALAQFYTPATLPKPLHTTPGIPTPNLSSGTSLTSTTYPNDVPVSATFARGVDAVSSVFMADALSNEYWNSTTIGATTEWVVMYPTKRFYTDSAYVQTAAAPFDSVFGTDIPGASCSIFKATAFDREESAAAPIVIEPPPPPEALCYTTQVVTFASNTAPTQVLGSALPAYFSTPFADGWGLIDLLSAAPSQHIPTSQDGKTFGGQPATGFRVTEFINGNLNGVLANYTASYPHHAHATCTSGSPAVPCS